MSAGPSPYLKNEVDAASAAGRIVMLYDRILAELRKADRALEQKEIEPRTTALVKANEIVLGLMSHLDMEQGGEIAAHLFDLYLYFSRSILEVNRTLNRDLLASLITQIAQLHEAWQIVAETEAAGARA